jgi:hypothetical protein
MHLPRMEGSWGSLSAWLYSRVVADGAVELHRRFVDEITDEHPASGLVVDLGCGEGRADRPS